MFSASMIKPTAAVGFGIFSQQKSRFATTMLGLQSRRGFSTIKPRVFSNAVFMPELYPAKLTIPASKEILYDFTCENQTTVADFRQ